MKKLFAVIVIGLLVLGMINQAQAAVRIVAPKAKQNDAGLALALKDLKKPWK